MTAKEVLHILQIKKRLSYSTFVKMPLQASIFTALKYVKEGRLKVTVKGNGRYDYDADSVYRMLNKDIERKTYLYARVSTPKQYSY